MLKFVLFVALAWAQDTSDSTVINLSGDNFDKIVKKSGKKVLVKFFAPWCGHCKRMAPEFVKAAEELAGNEEVVLADIDATIEEDLAQTYDVSGYPTLLWFSGGEPTEYDGGRDAEGIKQWVEGMIGEAVEEGTGPSVDEIVAGTPVVVLKGAAITDDFAAAADQMRRKAKFIFEKSSISDLYVQHKGEEKVVCGSVSTLDCFKENELPLAGVLDGDTFDKYMNLSKGLVWTLFEHADGEVETVADENRAMMLDVAKKNKAKYSVTYTDTHKFKEALEGMLGVTEFPAIVVQKSPKDKKKYVLKGTLETDKINAFLIDIEAGKIKPEFKTEEIPVEPQPDPVKTIVGATVEKMVFQKDKDVLLEIYAPWCGHCKKLAPEYEDLAKFIETNGFDKHVMIAKMDGTANDSPADSLSYTGFPTIYYIKAGSEPELYEGPRTAKGIWKWILENHSDTATLAAKAETVRDEL